MARYGRVRKAPKVIQMKTPPLNLNGLRSAYEWFGVDRVVAFKLAFEWYSSNLTTLLFGDPLDEQRQKTYDRALKSKNIGDSTDFGEEQATAYSTALHLYEKVWAARDLPKLDEAMSNPKPSKRVENVQTVLTSLNGAFAGLVRFRMTFGKEREYASGEVLLPEAELERMIPMTPLKVALQEAPTVAKVVSIVTDPATGEQSLDGGKFMATLPTLLIGVADWARGDRELAYKAIGKEIKAARTTAASPVAKAPRVASARTVIKDSMTITVITFVHPRMQGNRKQALDAVFTSPTVGDLKKTLTAMGGRMGTYTTWALKTALDAGCITIQ